VSHPNYTTRKALCGLSGSTSLSTVSYKSHHFVKILLSGINVFFFCTTRFGNFSFWKIFIEDWSKTVYRSSSRVLLICHNVMKLDFPLQAFKIFSNIKLHEFPYSGISCYCGSVTGRHGNCEIQKAADSYKTYIFSSALNCQLSFNMLGFQRLCHIMVK